MTTNIIGQLTELQVVSGGVFTESYPTNFHHFYTRKVLVGNETVDMFKDVAEDEMATIQAADAAWTAPSEELIAQAEAAGAVYNRATGFFELNGLTDIAGDEMRDMLSHVNEIFLPGGRCLYETKARTNIVTASSLGRSYSIDYVSLNGIAATARSIEILKIGKVQVMAGSISAFCYWCSNLKKVIGELDISRVTRISTSCFMNTLYLEDLMLWGLSCAINLGDSKSLSLDSIQYMVDNAANAAPITITLHPDAYARLTGDLIKTAADKKITFATK